MAAHRGVWQVGIAAFYLGLIVVVMRVLVEVRAFSQQQGSVWGARAQLLLFALFGVLVAGQALWGARNRVGSSVFAGFLTLVMATTHAAVVHVPRWLASVWLELGLGSNATLPAVAWGASLAALRVALYVHPRSGAEQASEEPVASWAVQNAEAGHACGARRHQGLQTPVSVREKQVRTPFRWRMMATRVSL